MTFAAPEPLASGLPYRVTDVAGQPARSLEQFVGQTEFGIDHRGTDARVKGVGVAREDGVRFHEKDLDHAGKDVRVWRIRPAAGEGFLAETTASF